VGGQTEALCSEREWKIRRQRRLRGPDHAERLKEFASIWPDVSHGSTSAWTRPASGPAEFRHFPQDFRLTKTPADKVRQSCSDAQAGLAELFTRGLQASVTRR